MSAECCGQHHDHGRSAPRERQLPTRPLGSARNQRSDVRRGDRRWSCGRLGVSPGRCSRFPWRCRQLRDQPLCRWYGAPLPRHGRGRGATWLPSSGYRAARPIRAAACQAPANRRLPPRRSPGAGALEPHPGDDRRRAGGLKSREKPALSAAPAGGPRYVRGNPSSTLAFDAAFLIRIATDSSLAVPART